MAETFVNYSGAETLYGDLRKRAASADENLAAAYSASSTYAVGDYCMYHDDLYVCKTAITTAEAWTAAHWTKVTVGDEFSALNSALLLLDDIPDTVQTLQRDAAGKVSGIVHTSTAAGGGVVRTDSYVFSDSAVVETRTLASGESLTITVNKTTKVTTLVYAAA